MRSRRLRWVLAGLAVVVAGAYVLVLRADRVTAGNCCLIKYGMNAAEVEAILGPPGDYRTGPTQELLPLQQPLTDDDCRTQAELEAYWFKRPQPDSGADVQTWKGDEGEIRVLIDAKVVKGSCCREMVRIPQSRLDNLLWRAKRLWRHLFPGR